MGFLSKTWDKITGADNAKKASHRAQQTELDASQLGTDLEAGGLERGAATTAGGQQEGLDYLRANDAVTQQGSTAAEQALMGIAGLGGTNNQQFYIDQAQDSPLYGAITGTRKAGEESIMRNAAQTGGLRSGNVQANMYDFNQRLDERALLESYDQQLAGLEGISQWNTNENNIYDAMLKPSHTLGAGEAGAAKIRADGAREMGGIESGGTLGRGQINADSTKEGLKTAAQVAAAIWSDRRLKDNVEFLGNHSGVNVYEWQWNALAEALGLAGYDTGVMADEIEITHPEAVGLREGYKTVNYDMLGV